VSTHDPVILDASTAADWMRDALDAMADLVGVHRPVHDGEGVIVDFELVYANPARRSLVGDPAADLVGARLRDLHPDGRVERLVETYATVLESGRSVLIEELPLRTQADGIVVDGCYTVAVSRFGDGVLAVAYDVTERQVERLRLADINHKFEAAQALAHIGIWAVDFDTGVATGSDELGRILGAGGGGEIEWRPGLVFDVIHPEDRGRLRDLIDHARDHDGRLATEARLVRLDGETRRVAVHAQITYDRGGVPNGVWGTVQDVTDQRLAEEALRETTSELAREQLLVERLQRAILPRLPERPGVEVAARYLPAGSGSRVGGDWYDVFLVGDDRLVFSIGDVAGHGIAAASLMAQLRNALRGAAYCVTDPAEVLHAVDRLVVEHAGDEFATCTFASLQLDRRRLHWANAGHPPLLIAERGQPPRYLATAGRPPLGVGVDLDEVHELEIVDGTLLIAYTDGLVEQVDESLDVGLRRLLAAVEVHRDEPLEALCESLSMVMFEGRVRRDDVCLLALRIAG
jgi:serine phosphatase RsbU (regulator of sigma subunit)/PAS domain-containing protein